MTVKKTFPAVAAENRVETFPVEENPIGRTSSSGGGDARKIHTTPDRAFRRDPTDKLWIFNINTKDQTLAAGRTYVFSIRLNDGSVIPFQFGVR